MHDIIKNILSKYKNLNVSLILGFELEFCIYSRYTIETINKFWSEYSSYKIKKEEGDRQFEISTHPSANIIDSCDEVFNLRQKLYEFASNYKIIISFSSTKNISFNAMQVNLSVKNNLDYAIASLMLNIAHDLPFMIEMQEDLLRFLNSKNFSPNTISCGKKNNRSVMIRKMKGIYEEYLEYRIPSSSANPYLVVAKMLDTILLGIHYKLIRSNFVYGNSADAQYDLPKIMPKI